jgi:hypothetical protein
VDINSLSEWDAYSTTPLSINFDISLSSIKPSEWFNLGTDHLTCRGWGYGFLFRSEFFFRTTRQLEYLIFLSRIARNFFPEFNITVSYMTKTLNQIIFFPPPKSEYFFQQHWESEYFFYKKNHNHPTPPPGS